MATTTSRPPTKRNPGPPPEDNPEIIWVFSFVPDESYQNDENKHYLFNARVIAVRSFDNLPELKHYLEGLAGMWHNEVFSGSFLGVHSARYDIFYDDVAT